jgi:GTP-binding protein
MKHYEQELRDALPDKADYPVVFISAKTGQRVRTILDIADRINRARKLHVSTAELNRFTETLPIPPGAGDITIRYCTQTGAEPPAFALFMSDPAKVKDNFTRYVERAIRKTFGFEGTPIHLSFRK